MPSAGTGLPFFVDGERVDRDVFANTLPPESLKELVKDIPPRPVFLIHAKGEDVERGLLRVGRRAGQLGALAGPGAKHVGGLEARAGGVRAARHRVLRPRTSESHMTERSYR